METAKVLSVLLLCVFCLASGTADGMKQFGYTIIRPDAHMFWLFYKSPQRVSLPGKPWPTILWLAGGPGVSGVGVGNFGQIGPLDVDLKPRDSTWLKKADLIFVDSPVGVGYSYVDHPDALAKTDQQAATDVFELIKVLLAKNIIPTLQSSPLYLVGESYGGKLAAKIGVLVSRSIRAGTLNLTLGGVVLGDSWISPDDYALSYPLLLHTMSRLDDNAVPEAIRMGMTIKQQTAAEQFPAAYRTFVDLFTLINNRSAQVNLQNIMSDNPITSPVLGRGTHAPDNTLDGIMNGVVKEELNIPKDITWQATSLNVFHVMNDDFMIPAINEVDELLRYGDNVTVYNGQLDLICSTIGTESWLRKLRWNGLHDFLSLPRKPLYYCPLPYQPVNAFVRSHKNLNFYWVLRAGHTVPVDQPCTAVNMIDDIVQSPVGQ